MGEFSATDAALSGFSFVRRRPAAVALWAVILLVIHLAFGAALVALAGPELAAVQAANLSGPQDPAAALALMARLLPLYAATALFALVFFSIAWATIDRAVLREGDAGFGYVRLGADEVRQGLLLLLIFAVMLGAELVAGVLLGVAIVVVSLILRAPGGEGVVPLITFLIAFCAFVFVSVRLSLTSPLTFDTRKVDLFGSWRLTRGRFWKMLGAYVLVWMLAILVYILVAIIAVALAAAIGGGLNGIALMFRPDSSSAASYFSPVRLVIMVVNAAASALVWPLLLMPSATIYRQIRDATATREAAADPVA